MATLPSEFWELADELINDEFKAFAPDAVINHIGPFDYATQNAPVEATQTKPMIRLEYSTRQLDGQLIKTGDIMLIGAYQDFDFEPSPDKAQVIYGSVNYDLTMVPSIDPANATIVLHCRPR